MWRREREPHIPRHGKGAWQTRLERRGRGKRASGGVKEEKGEL